MASSAAIPAVETHELVSDPRWPSYRSALLDRLALLRHRLELGTHDHPQMCRLAGEIRGLRFALGLPAELSTSDPRSD